MDVPGVGMSRFSQKLKQVRTKLRGWSREVFGNITSRVKTTEATYRLREEEYDRCRNEATRFCLNAARADYNRELAVECEFWRQKAAVKWLREGDANTSYFHSIVHQRRSSNFIARIKDEGGRWCDSEQLITASAIDFYAKLFTSEAACRGGFPEPPFVVPAVDRECNGSLMAVPTAEEIREVVFAMEVNSAPGPDGFGVGFYQVSWSIIKDDLVAAISVFFQGVGQPRGWSSALLVLIPKVEGACQWRDFRPISLCNVNSKIISKILATRLNKVLPQIIAP